MYMSVCTSTVPSLRRPSTPAAREDSTAYSFSHLTQSSDGYTYTYIHI